MTHTLTLNSVKTATVATLAILGMSVAVAAPASANDDVQFRFDARQLDTQAGTLSVFTALKNTAQTACAQTSARSLMDARMAQDCTDKLVRELVGKIGHEGLTAIAITG